MAARELGHPEEAGVVGQPRGRRDQPRCLTVEAVRACGLARPGSVRAITAHSVFRWQEQSVDGGTQTPVGFS